jgi:hypothetical protein
VRTGAEYISLGLMNFGFLTTLAFWLRSSVVSVLNSLTTIMKASPSFLVILFLQPLFFELCLQLGDAMTLLLHYWLASSGDLSLLFLTLLTVVNWQHLELGKRIGLLHRVSLLVFLLVCPYANSK